LGLARPINHNPKQKHVSLHSRANVHYEVY
jgi:hypothetical protein